VVNGATGIARAALLLDAHDARILAFERRQPLLAARFVLDRELFEFFTLEVGELGDEGLCALVAVQVQGPVLARHEGLDLQLALDDHPERGRLHAAGGKTGADLLPQQR